MPTSNFIKKKYYLLVVPSTPCYGISISLRIFYHPQWIVKTRHCAWNKVIQLNLVRFPADTEIIGRQAKADLLPSHFFCVWLFHYMKHTYLITASLAEGSQVRLLGKGSCLMPGLGIVLLVLFLPFRFFFLCTNCWIYITYDTTIGIENLPCWWKSLILRATTSF